MDLWTRDAIRRLDVKRVGDSRLPVDVPRDVDLG
jgi:hypothetical protein